MVVDLFNLKTRLMDTSLHILGVVHLRVAVGDGCEVEACHGETEGRRLEALTIPERLHDIDARL